MNRRFLGVFALMVGLTACGESEPKGGGDPTPICNPDDTLCGDSCVDTGTDPRHCGACGTSCGASEVCSDGACTVSCPGGQVACGGGCFDLGSSSANCGACGTTCDAGEACAEGACVAECPSGQNACDGGCFDLESARDHCGACGVACAAGEICTEGACQTSCPAGQEACNGACFNLDTAGNHCGACGNSCEAGQVCADGTCGTSCTAGLTDCDGSCLDLDSDRANCGACGTTCGNDQLCIDGACTLTCAPGTTDCDGTCRATEVDRNNCGGCGIACGAEQICADGACVTSCGSYASDICDGACTNVDTDPRNCGACGTVCEAGEVCSEGVCADSCAPTADVCADGCTSLQNDPENCGACGTVCVPADNALPVCSAGSCESVCAFGYGDCNGDLSASGSNGCESVLTADVNNCGGCGIACTGLPNSLPSCNFGTCGIGACKSGFYDCDFQPANGCEVEIAADEANCGGCGVVCAAGEECRAGACTAPSAGDTCDLPFRLTAGSQTIYSDATGREYLGKAPSCSSTAPNGPDVVMEYTANFDGGVRVVLDKPASRRWHLVVSEAACGAVQDELRCVTEDKVTMETSFRVVSGRTYHIYIVGTGSTAHLTAQIPVTVTEVPDANAGAGESCATAIALADGPNTIQWSATVGDYLGTGIWCASSTVPAVPDYVLRYDATYDGGVELLFDNPSGMRWFAVVDNGACGTLEQEWACTASPFGASAMRSAFNVTRGQSYFIYVSGSNLSNGALPPSMDVRVNPIDCTTMVPAITTLSPASGTTATTLRPTFEVGFSHSVNPSAGTITLTGNKGTVQTFTLPNAAVKFSADTKAMTVTTSEFFQSGEQITASWSGLNDIACNKPMPVDPWTVGAVDAGICSPGQDGMVGTTMTRMPLEAVGYADESYVAVDPNPNGWVYVGHYSKTLLRTPKTGGPFENIGGAAKLTADHAGYTMVLDGQNIYTVNDAVSGINKRLWRISADGGANWAPVDVANFGTSTANDPEDDFRGATAHGGRIYLITHEATASAQTQIWSVEVSGTLPATARIEQQFPASDYRNCSGLAMDTQAWFTICSVQATSVYAVVRIDRGTGAVTQLTNLVSGNTTVNAIHVSDRDGDGAADYLYTQDDGEEAFFVCNPHTAAPHTEKLYNFGNGSGNYGLGFDPSTNTLWQFDDDTSEFVKIK